MYIFWVQPILELEHNKNTEPGEMGMSGFLKNWTQPLSQSKPQHCIPGWSIFTIFGDSSLSFLISNFEENIELVLIVIFHESVTLILVVVLLSFNFYLRSYAIATVR